MKQMGSQHSYRPSPAVREAVSRLSTEQDRSINWMLDELVKKGLATIAAETKNAPTVDAAGAPI
jgi:hypothetical protein